MAAIDLGFGDLGIGDLLSGGAALAKLGGGIVGAVGAGQVGAGQAASMRAQAMAYLQDARLQGDNAAQARFALGRQQREADYLKNRVIGTQRALYGAAGVNPVSGSPLDVLRDTEDQARQEALNRFYTGQNIARQASQQSEFDVAAAQAEEQAARTAQKSASTSGFGSILGGIGGALGIVGKFFGL